MALRKIKIKYHADIDRVKKIVKGDWIDLRAAEDVFVPLNKMAMIPLGVSMELPAGYEAHVVPRSSTFKNYGIIMTNSMGIIDNTYCGNDDIWQFPALCIMPTAMKDGVQGSLIRKNDRICQFRIIAFQPGIEFEEVEYLDNYNRGGFGSTGVN